MKLMKTCTMLCNTLEQKYCFTLMALYKLWVSTILSTVFHNLLLTFNLSTIKKITLLNVVKLTSLKLTVHVNTVKTNTMSKLLLFLFSRISLKSLLRLQLLTSSHK